MPFLLGLDFLQDKKCGFTFIDFFNYAKIKIDLNDHFLLEKKNWLCKIFSYFLSQFLIKTITIITLNFFKISFCINQLKKMTAKLFVAITMLRVGEIKVGKNKKFMV